MKTRVGLLIDLNALPHFTGEDQENIFNDENFTALASDEICSNSFSTDISSIDSRLERKIHQLSEFTLEQLTKDGTLSGNFNPDDFQFTYRFFDSSKYFQPVKELRTFVPLNVESFDLFEKSLDTEVRAFVTTNEKQHSPEVNKLSLVSSAFKGMISDLDWSGGISSTTTSLHRSTSSSSLLSQCSSDSISPLNDSLEEGSVFRNIIHVFFRVPRDEDELQLVFDDSSDKLNYTSSSRDFLNAFVPKAFLNMITHNYKIRVNFVDMWALHWHKSEALGAVSYPPSILKVLRFLHSGQIFHPTIQTLIGLDLPSWGTILKNNLKACTTYSVTSRGNGSETSHISDSSRCSTPIENFKCNLQAMMKIEREGSATKREPGQKGSSTELRKDALFNNSQTQSLSQPSRVTTRVHQRFTSKSQHTILLHKSTKLTKPFSSDCFDFLRIKSNTRGPTIRCASAPGPSPNSKRVRRNLFSVNSQQEPNEAIQRLLTTTETFNYRSPSSSRSGSLPRSLFRSPRTSPSDAYEFKSPGSSNVLKSKRRLDLDVGHNRNSFPRSPLAHDSPIPVFENTGVICPESPATPPSKRTKTTISISSCEKRGIVYPSPEAGHSRNLLKSHLTRHDSFTFYSNSSSESPSRTSKGWEDSGKKLKVARIRDSVDLSQITTSSLSLDDLEMIDPMDSPLPKRRNLVTSKWPALD